MKKIFLILFPVLAFINPGISQENLCNKGSKMDEQSSFKNLVDHSKLPIRSDTLISYKITKANGQIRTAENIRTIEVIDYNGECRIKLTTDNKPVGPENTSRLTAILRYTDLQLISLDMKSKLDSAHVEYVDGHLTGWSQLPNEKRKVIDMYYMGNLTIGEGNTPWIPGLFDLSQDKSFSIPGFRLHTNEIRIRSTKVLKNEILTVDGRNIMTWKIDAGPSVGTAGYTSYHWYEYETGRLIKTELIKNGADVKYISVLKNL